MSDAVTVTDEALCALVARIPDRNPERPAEDYLPALRAAFATQPQDQRLAELELYKTRVVELSLAVQILQSQLKAPHAERDQSLAREEQLREDAAALVEKRGQSNTGVVHPSSLADAAAIRALPLTPPQALSKRDGEVLALTEALRFYVEEWDEEDISSLSGDGGPLTAVVPSEDLCEDRGAIARQTLSSTQAAQDAEERIEQRTLANADTFQNRVAPWMQECFGPEISADITERNHRFLEEALELVQSTGCTASEAHQLVDYVFNRDIGDVNQEIGGVMVTLAALCLASGFNMHQEGETELKRIWGKIEQIRTKQAAKPDHSPLPGSLSSKGEG
ncbi:hypothetical protein ABWH92_12165 [Ahrensia marina]|uniref:hypothetical protein n=1 Tax=Ahrensia marina TaxID=1514904 RepID=UPI0035CF86D3